MHVVHYPSCFTTSIEGSGSKVMYQIMCGCGPFKFAVNDAASTLWRMVKAYDTDPENETICHGVRRPLNLDVRMLGSYCKCLQFIHSNNLADSLAETSDSTCYEALHGLRANETPAVCVDPLWILS